MTTMKTPNQEIQALNDRIQRLSKVQESAKTSLAVEEHKLKQIEQELKQLGYDVSELTEDEIKELVQQLEMKLTEGISQLQQVLDKADQKIAEFNQFLEQHPE